MQEEITNASKALFKEIKQGLQKSTFAQDFLKSVGYSETEIKKAPIGYISNPEWVIKNIENQPKDKELLKTWGVLDAGMRYRVVVGWQQPDKSLKLWGASFGEKNKGEKPVLFQNAFKKDHPFLYNQYLNNTHNEIILIESPIDAARLIANNIPAMALGVSALSSEQIKPLAQKQKDYLYVIPDNAKGRAGAEKLILALSSLDISIKIIEINAAWATEHALLTKTSIDDLKKKVDKYHLSAGQFLASRVGLQKKQGSSKQNFEQKLIDWHRQLNQQDQKDFKRYLYLNKIYMKKDLAEILRVLANLIDSGIEKDKALAMINKKYDLDIKL